MTAKTFEASQFLLNYLQYRWWLSIRTVFQKRIKCYGMSNSIMKVLVIHKISKIEFMIIERPHSVLGKINLTMSGTFKTLKNSADLVQVHAEIARN